MSVHLLTDEPDLAERFASRFRIGRLAGLEEPIRVLHVAAHQTVEEALERARGLALGTQPGALLVLSERTDGATWARLLAEADEVLPWPIADDVVIGRLEKLASRSSATLVAQASRLTHLGFWRHDDRTGESIW